MNPCNHTLSRAVFLDKDGTLVVDRPYNVDPSQVEFREGAFQAMQKLERAGYKLFMVSNQGGVAHGRFRLGDLEQLKNWFFRTLMDQGITLEDFYYCPHDPRGVISEYAKSCECRKPRDGMIRRAAKEHNIDLGASWMLGDILDDIEAGHRAGCRSILLDIGNETEWLEGRNRNPDFYASCLMDAAEYVLSCSGAHPSDRRIPSPMYS